MEKPQRQPSISSSQRNFPFFRHRRDTCLLIPFLPGVRYYRVPRVVISCDRFDTRFLVQRIAARKLHRAKCRSWRVKCKHREPRVRSLIVKKEESYRSFRHRRPFAFSCFDRFNENEIFFYNRQHLNSIWPLYSNRCTKKITKRYSRQLQNLSDDRRSDSTWSRFVLFLQETIL